MFPMEFEYDILSGLPLPGEERIQDLLDLLEAIVERRIVPYFKTNRGTDPLKLGRVTGHLSLHRLEDDQGQSRAISLLGREDEAWNIYIHERIFDYLSFVFPRDADETFASGTTEEQKMLAFCELLLRHQVDHILYPERSERDIIAADVDFAMDLRNSDPTLYRMLRKSLTDELNGIRGEHYVALLDRAEQDLPYLDIIGTLINSLAATLANMPDALLQRAFPSLDEELKARVLGEHYRRSRDNTLPIMQRAASLSSVLHLFALVAAKSDQEAKDIFHSFKDRWGLVVLFRELGLPESSVDGKAPQDLFKLFMGALERYITRDQGVPAAYPAPGSGPQRSETPERKHKSLTDRIEEARNDPSVPRRVMEVIDKNKLNAVGHSGSKYSELIETLLAIPWGRIQKIEVAPEAFEEGLNKSHYGLQRPKETICDFFTNLIWRYQRFNDGQASSWHRTGSAFLFVGPPGVGKTSLAISIARNLGIPYHKISLGGMRDEADMRGHGFTYEGSKPGAIVQGLIKMEVMNGMFILDEADKTEKFAIATLLEILDPEQNHLFHDKYTETTVDIDLSNCHFLLTANTLEGVPPVVANRCEIIFLDRYSVEEKIAIAREHLISRVRERYQIDQQQIFFDEKTKSDLLRYLVRNYTYEAGVRELERTIRTLFLRIQRKEILTKGERSVRITREKIKAYLDEPIKPRQINEDDQSGEMLGLGVDLEKGVGSVIPIQATRIGMGATGGGIRRAYLSITHATGNIEKIMDESRKVATTGIFHRARALHIDLQSEEPVHLHFMGGSTRKDGPSAGGAIALALASLLSGRKIRRDVAMTGEIDTRGRITSVGGLALKIETAYNAGCRTVVIPRENLHGEGGIERFPQALKDELQILTFDEWQGAHEPFDYTRHILQVVAVDDIVQAAQVAFIDEAQLENLKSGFLACARSVSERLRCKNAHCVKIMTLIQVKNPQELDVRLLQQSWQTGRALALLVPPDTHQGILERLGEHSQSLKVYDFDPRRQNLSATVHTILQAAREGHEPIARLNLIGPFYFLKKYGIERAALLRDGSCSELRLFANNYTLQEVKIKGCKAVLDQVFSLLGRFDETELKECPFIALKDDVYVIDMGFIPEKYRLDVKRAETILNEYLMSWLESVPALSGPHPATGRDSIHEPDNASSSLSESSRALEGEGVGD
ncbi:S16 family serine protease [Desulfoferrobacter suflitae]|uniref:S16 family serine protease n=1 Tax=Desulfoferrobacter suflitae TaxID=2865782 RepID=UPI0021646D68|nr:S16 family serine protease [Desulfoferrobacter suflitae]MCK8602492.1 AAA family ATPase [Desulfoferrobacter suflitae]